VRACRSVGAGPAQGHGQWAILVPVPVCRPAALPQTAGLQPILDWWSTTCASPARRA